VNRGKFQLGKWTFRLASIIPAGSISQKGFVGILGEDEHILAPYTYSLGKPILGEICPVDSPSLKDISRKAKGLSLCFSPRSLYADVGDFSCISPEATSAHIRSSIDKIGLFKDNYHISFIKIKDIDNIKSKYSYLAISSYEMSRTELLDENEALVDMFCPIEASIAAAVAVVDMNMAIIVYEDARFIRIIGAKAGIIYYLITINSAESFDAEADTVSGIREMTSMLMNSYQERVQKVYTIGHGDVCISDLEQYDICTEHFHMNESGDADPFSIVLLDTTTNPRYDFTPERLHQTKKIVSYAKYSMAVSLALLLIATMFFILGWNNKNTADDYKKKTNSAIFKSAQELKALEDDYSSLSKNLDLTKVNKIIDVYKDYEAEPKFNVIVDAVSSKVPDNVFITKIDATRPTTQETSPQAGVVPAATQAHLSHIDSFNIVIEGIINSPYPQSKNIFSSFTEAIHELYTINNATFKHKDQGAEFTLNCDVKL
jgi:hypothetical protein